MKEKTPLKLSVSESDLGVFISSESKLNTHLNESINGKQSVRNAVQKNQKQKPLAIRQVKKELKNFVDGLQYEGFKIQD